MTAKQFFKSTAFKCIVVLVSIVLVCCVFLTICNSLFYVSDEEKLSRAISKIYGKDVNTEAVTENSSKEAVNYPYSASNAEITEAYLVTDDGNYLIKSKGKGGYSGGTVTCWIVVRMNGGAISGIDKVVVDSNTSQTQMAEITEDSILGKFTESYEDGKEYTTDDGYMVTGSTKSSNAVCNSVNGAIEFVKTQICGDTVDNSTPYDSYSYTDLIDKKKTTHTVDGTTVKYTVTTQSYGAASAFVIDVSVSADKTITAYTITDNGSTNGYENKMAASVSDGTLFTGKSLSFFTDFYGSNMAYKVVTGVDNGSLTTGATTQNYSSNSTYLCAYAAAFATANYDTAVQGGN